MGLIQRQGFKHTIVTFAGLILGAVNMLFLYPKVLPQEEFGIFQYVVRNAQMLFPFFLLGSGSVVIRFLPFYRERYGDARGFMPFVLAWALAGMVVFSLLAVAAGDRLLEFFDDKSPLFRAYLPYMIPIIFSMGLSFVLTNQSANFGRIVVPAIFNNAFLKFSMAVLVLLVAAGKLQFPGFMGWTIAVYFSILVLLAGYLYFLGGITLRSHWRPPDRPMRREMFHFAGFSILGGMGVILASQIDIFMVGLLIDLRNVAVYSIGFMIADVIDVPRRSIEQIAAPQVAQAWQRNDKAQIGSLYQKSAVNQLAIGLLLLLWVWLPLDSLFELIPNGEAYAAGKEVVFILGISKLFEMMSGINRLVITYSRYYRFLFYATLVLALLNIVSNLIFIPLFQIAGAALATAFAAFLYNAVRVWFAWRRFGLHPFSGPMGGLMALAGVVYLMVWLLPSLPNPWLDIPYKVAVTGVLYGGGVYYFRLSEELRRMVEEGVRRIL